MFLVSSSRSMVSSVGCRGATTGRSMGLRDAMAGGAALALAGVIFVLLAVTLLIANALPLWVSSLVVGVVALFVGYVMVKAAQKRVSPAAFVPGRAADSVKKDAETARRAMQ